MLPITRGKNALRALLKHYPKKWPKQVAPMRPGSTSNQDDSLKEGDTVEGFVVNKIQDIPEFHLTAFLLKHASTSAQYLHLSRDDPNNVFAISFRTTPLDSTGVAHILEHMVLCGSEDFYCRDPYFKMLDRSMATFMNAITGCDYTLYPFATQNPVDYYNLMWIYLDAVFHPLLRETDFLQEGWRLEHTKVDDRTTPLVLKGVVLNEMKGVYADNEHIFLQSLMSTILPSHTYAVASGGDPLHIPKLKYKALLEFHRLHYHPSNARLYSYGNLPLIERLHFVNKKFLSKYKEGIDYSEATEVPSEYPWNAGRTGHVDCKPDKMADPDKQSSLAISNLCCDITNNQEVFDLSILSLLLTQGPSSPFYKALVEPNKGSGFSPVTGYNSHTKTTYFSVGLQGMNRNDFPWAIDAFNACLDKVIEEGFTDDQIEAVLHSIELGIRHQPSNFGLALLYAIIPAWTNDADVIELMKMNNHVAKFRKSLKENPTFLKDYMVKYLKNNSHRLLLTMSPSKQHEESLKLQEDQLLKGKLNKMSEAELQDVYEKSMSLKYEQEKTEDLSCLPTLTLSDVQTNIEKVVLTNVEASGVPIQFSVQPTNGILYYYGILGSQRLPTNVKNILPLFSFIADKMGTAKKNYREFEQRIQLTSGGFSFKYFNNENPKVPTAYEEGIMISSHCLDRNVEQMFELWLELFNHLTLDDMYRFHTLLSVLTVDSLNGINQCGHQYAMIASASLVSIAGKRAEICSGITFLKRLQYLNLHIDAFDVLDLMKSAAPLILNKKTLRLAVNVNNEGTDCAVKEVIGFCEKLDGNVKTDVIQDPAKRTEHDSAIDGIHYIIPSSVSFAAKSVMTVPFTHDDFPVLTVLCRLLSMKFLLPEIREKGGAYGAGVSVSNGGVLTFYSYKDPYPADSFAVFDRALNWITETKLDESDVEEAKIGSFQTLDTPVSPAQKGMVEFLQGIDHETMDAHRRRLKKVTLDELRYIALRYLNLSYQIPQGRALVGPENKEVTLKFGNKWSVID